MRQRINNERVCASSPLIFIRQHPTEVLFATCRRRKPRDLTGLLHFLHAYDVMTTRDINQKRFQNGRQTIMEKNSYSIRFCL